MFTTGSKLLLGATFLAAVAAVAYGTTQDGVMGTVGLVSAAIALGFIAAINIWLRDSNVRADSEASVIESSSAALRAPARSPWPLGFGLALAITAIGLVTYQAFFIVGVLLIIAAGGEWVLQSWAERASSDSAYNSEVRGRLAGPLEFPLAGAIAVGILVYSFSRVMLWLSKTNTVVAVSIAAAIVLGFAFLFAYRRGVPKTMIAGLSSIAVVAIVAGGVAAGVDGERDIHEFETIGSEHAEEICESPEEFEADEDASQTVSDSADIAATITLTDAEELIFDTPGGVEEGAPGLQLPRSNPSNIIFVNESDHERRLSVDLGLIDITTEDGATGVVPNLTCTSLVETDGQQMLTLTVYVPSVAQPDGYHFFVPGLDGAEIDLVVP